MTDVTGVRHPGKTRPLGVVKDETMYYDSPRYSQSFYKSISREKVVPKDMKETLQQATLINIVAAVNDSYTGDGTSRKQDIEPGSAIDSLSNTMAVISNLMSPRDRTISIPTTQVVFQLPEKVVQRKPVYYKHSEDEEVKREAHFSVGSTTGYQMKVKPKQEDRRKTTTPEKVVKVIPAKTPTLQPNGDTQKWVKEPNKMVHSRSWSPVRRLGALNKRPESRKVREISKCDVIDIMDTTESLKHTQAEFIGAPSVNIGTEPQVCGRQSSTIPFYRAKSLPALFPAKTSRLIRSVQSNRTSVERPKPRPPSRGFGKNVTENLSVVQGKTSALSGSLILDGTSFRGSMDQESDRQSPRRIASRQKQKSPFRATQILTKQLTATEITPEEQLLQQSLKSQQIQERGKVTQNHKKTTATTSSDKTKDTNSTMTENESFSRNLSESWPMYARPSSESNLSEVSAVIQSRNSAKSRKSCIMSRDSIVDEQRTTRTPKRVKFAGALEDTVSFSTDEPLPYSEHEEPYHSPAKAQLANRESSETHLNRPVNKDYLHLPPQTITVQELDRLKQKLIPTDVQAELSNHQGYNFAANNAGMQISSLQRMENDFSNLSLSSDSDEKDSDLFLTDEKDELRNDPNGQYDRYSSLTDIDDDDEEDADTNKDSPTSLEDTQDEAFYKVLKAVDRDSYSGFEHKKIRKASGSASSRTRSDHAKAHFVKVKFGDSV